MERAGPGSGDEPVEGLWFDRTQESAARLQGEAFERDRFATPEIAVLSSLPCWRHLSPEKQREREEALAGLKVDKHLSGHLSAGLTIMPKTC